LRNQKERLEVSQPMVASPQKDWKNTVSREKFIKSLKKERRGFEELTGNLGQFLEKKRSA